ncbi:MAG: phosphoribosylanthranilate isomerase [Proteobacteria bacterium]|nr:phosphoribosylanthranilate isomerase [Pseudomonadota bacterium]
MRPKIKICGVTLADDAAAVAATPGVDFIGLNFWPKSKRHVDLERAALLAGVARGAGPVQIVGVFCDPDVDDIVALLAQVRLDAIQLHGDERASLVAKIANATQLPVWKAVAVGSLADLDDLAVVPTETILLDAPSEGRGGAGKTFDWSIATAAHARYPARRFVIAGGLTAGNVGEAIAACAPWGVDVASGVEVAPGIKDAQKVAAFVAAVAGAST